MGVQTQRNTDVYASFKFLFRETQELSMLDYVPPHVPSLSSRGNLIMVQDTGVVINMCVKVREPTMRHVQRSHSADADSFL